MTPYENLTTRAAHAVGLSGTFSQGMFILDKPSMEKWGEALFDPLGMNADAFMLAGWLDMDTSYTASAAFARPHLTATGTVCELFNGDKFKAMRLAIVHCAINIKNPKL